MELQSSVSPCRYFRRHRGELFSGRYCYTDTLTSSLIALSPAAVGVGICLPLRLPPSPPPPVRAPRGTSAPNSCTARPLPSRADPRGKRWPRARGVQSRRRPATGPRRAAAAEAAAGGPKRGPLHHTAGSHGVHPQKPQNYTNIASVAPLCRYDVSHLAHSELCALGPLGGDRSAP